MSTIELVDALTEARQVPVTSDAGGPVDIPLADPGLTSVIVTVTTDGSGGAQIVNLPAPPLTGGVNKDYAGTTYTIQAILTDPADEVHITNIGSADAYLYITNIENNNIPYITDPRITEAAQMVIFVWCMDMWTVNVGITDSFFDFTRNGLTCYISGGATSVNGPGGSVALYGREAQSNGDGGDVIFHPGGGRGAGRDGLVMVDQSNAALPTADPLVAGALFTIGAPSAGVPKALMISGG